MGRRTKTEIDVAIGDNRMTLVCVHTDAPTVLDEAGTGFLRCEAPEDRAGQPRPDGTAAGQLRRVLVDRRTLTRQLARYLESGFRAEQIDLPADIQRVFVDRIMARSV